MLNCNYLQWGYLEDKYFPKWGFIEGWACVWNPPNSLTPSRGSWLQQQLLGIHLLQFFGFLFLFQVDMDPLLRAEELLLPPPPFTSYIVSTPPGGFPPPQGFPQGYGTPPPFSKWPPGAGAHPAPNSAFTFSSSFAGLGFSPRVSRILNYFSQIMYSEL